MEDPEGFLGGLQGRRIVLDEVHRLANPSELLKIAADHFPDVKVIATGSSTLGATAKFADTLAGRKETVWLTPMLLADMEISARSGSHTASCTAACRRSTSRMSFPSASSRSG